MKIIHIRLFRHVGNLRIPDCNMHLQVKLENAEFRKVVLKIKYIKNINSMP